jgi:hypothetical protein
MHRVAPGLQTPPHALAMQALAHAVGGPHCPVWSQLSTVVELVHWVAPGLQTPPQAPLAHALGQGELCHAPALEQVCSVTASEHCVAPGVQTPVH